MAMLLHKLPLELRQQIYRELLLVTQDSLPPYGPDRVANTSRKQLHSNILRACKQTYAEASLVLYEESHYACDWAPAFWNYYQEGADVRAFGRIKHLQLTCDAMNYFLRPLLDSIRASGAALKTLGLVFDLATIEYSQHACRNVYELGGRTLWIELSEVLEKTSFIAAVAALDVERTLEISVASNRAERRTAVEDFAAAVAAEKEWSVVAHREVARVEGNEDRYGDDGGHVRMVWTFTLEPLVVGK